MINRSLQRCKVLQLLYCYSLVPSRFSLPSVIEEFQVATGSIYDLYMYLLGLPLDVAAAAEERLEVLKGQYRRVPEEETEALRGMTSNALTQYIKADVTYMAFREEMEPHKSALQEYMAQVVASAVEERSEALGRLDWESLESVQVAWRELYGKAFLQSEVFGELLEQSVYLDSWTVDQVLSFVTKAFNAISEEKLFSEIRRKPYASSQDEAFGIQLLRNAIEKKELYREWVARYFVEWDADRVSRVDYLILQLAVTEAELFPDTPTRVILNEYLNLAHLFSSEQSHVFINGILHPLLQDLREGKTKSKS